MTRLIKHLFVALLTFVGFASYAQFYQGSNLEFGKNRVQYREFDWYYYPGEHFEVYYYIGGEQLAQYTLMSCEKNLPELSKFYDFSLDDKVQVLSFMKQSEFWQSNIGMSSGELTNLGGTAKIIGNKMFSYYEGSHELLEKQIRQNLSRLLFTQMIYGGDWKDVLKTSTMLSIPKWFEEGAIRYAAEGPSQAAENFVKDKIQNKRFKSLNRLYGEDATLVGQAFWSYIEEVYGRDKIATILYMTRLSRNVESGFLFVLGLTLDKVMADFVKHYRMKYSGTYLDRLPGMPAPPVANDRAAKRAYFKENKLMGDLKVKYKSKYHYTQFKLSPDGKYTAFVTNELGQYKLWLKNNETNKLKLLLKREHKLERLADESYPVLAWHPTSEVLTFVTERKGRAFISNYNVTEKKKTEKELFRLEKVIDMSYSSDGKKIVFSGVNRGHTDLYLYQVIGNNQEQLTNDIYDDMQPEFIEGSNRIIFCSNRPDDTLRKNVPVDIYPLNKDVYIFNVENRTNILERITNTPDVDEHHPSEYSNLHYTYMAPSYGVDNRFLAHIDSSISGIDTTIHYRYFTQSAGLSSFPRAPKDYQFNASSGNYLLHFLSGPKPVIYFGQKVNDRGQTPAENGVTTEGPMSAPQNFKHFIVSGDSLKKPIEVNIADYDFESDKKDYEYERKTISIQEAKDTTHKDSLAKKFELPKSRNYRLNFATDYVLFQANNSYNSLFYQNYTSPTSINPGLSGFVNLGVSDLMEDYKVVGGYRLGFNFTNNNYSLTFDNLKNRWDRRVTFQRQSNTYQTNVSAARVQTNSVASQWKYPFSELSSVRFTLTARHDRIVQLAVDPTTLAYANVNEYNLGMKAEYVFDNTFNKGLNLYNGTRFKAWAERMQQPSTLGKRSDFNIVGFDFRHYQKIHRELIAAIRFAGATSFGYYKLINYLGGVDNWLNQKIDYSVPIATDQNYSFQSFVGPVRGFWVNARNGNSTLFTNAEIRLPLFKYLMQKPIKSDFIENFQVVGFFDAGAAWTGVNPYSGANAFNYTTQQQVPVTVTIHNNREPIIYGYGFGVRSRVLGYFMRLDWAWGVDDHIVMPRVFYLSMNLDF
jgi:hypothetical protein